jgi:hypothetical protein
MKEGRIELTESIKTVRDFSDILDKVAIDLAVEGLDFEDVIIFYHPLSLPRGSLSQYVRPFIRWQTLDTGKNCDKLNKLNKEKVQ